MPALLVSLGTSQAIVAEAYFLPGVSFDAVHVLTTASVQVDEVVAFFSEQAPGVALTISRVVEMNGLDSEEDHFGFNEVLLRWILDTNTTPGSRYFCLSGGYKSMSAAVQKAATILGAVDVFHVLADAFITTTDGKKRLPLSTAEIIAARNGNHLRFIRLGAESGWPQARNLSAVAYPIAIVSTCGVVRDVSAPDRGLSTHLHTILERSRRIAGSWGVLAQLPFPELATWSEGDLAWLGSPIDASSDQDRRWISQLPKVELHCHLGGFATHGEQLSVVRAAARFPERLPLILDRTTPRDWPCPHPPLGLDAYMKLGDNTGSRILSDPGCLRAQCHLLYEHLVANGVVYAEIRCSPSNYATPDRSPYAVLSEIQAAFQACMETRAEPTLSGPPRSQPCHVNLIIIATRKSGGDRSDISRHLALAITAADQWRGPQSCKVVGVDLAGLERTETRAAIFQSDFEAVHRVGLAVTVHAGENDDAEGIWQAVFKLNARRIGHGLLLGTYPDLLRAVADRGIGVEMCPYANLQIRGFAPLNNSSVYPLLHYLKAGVRVSLNTDNIGISSASLSDNLLLAAKLSPGLTRLQLLWLQRHALDTAFVSAAERASMVSRFDVSPP